MYGGNSKICNVDSEIREESEGCQAIVHLARGQKAWVQPYSHYERRYKSASYFTGFLINDDPM